MNGEQRVTKRKVVMSGLPEILNPRGVEMLCQAVLASGIKDHDEDFINGQTVKFYIENGFRNTPYSLSQYHLLYSSYRKEKQRNQFSDGKIPLEEFKKLVYVTPLKKLAEYYGKSPDAIRAFCSRHEIYRRRKH